jgi:hypothetical protein
VDTAKADGGELHGKPRKMEGLGSHARSALDSVDGGCQCNITADRRRRLIGLADLPRSLEAPGLHCSDGYGTDASSLLLDIWLIHFLRSWSGKGEVRARNFRYRDLRHS